MNRYKKANDSLRVPDSLKAGVIRKNRHRSFWVSTAAAVTALAVALAVVFWPVPADEPEQNNFPLNSLIPVANAAELIAAPEYPEMAPAPNWEDWDQAANDAWHADRQAQRELRPEDDSALYDYYYDTAREFLADSGEDNAVYSPLNIYLTLSMLAELTDGQTREQILDVLNCQSLEELRALAGGLWNVNYCDDGQVTSLLASSLWLRDDMDYHAETMQTLADTYYASSYRGVMGTEGMNQAFRNWLNENTGNLLTDQTNELELSADTVLALASTLYFKAAWQDTFSEANTAEDIFHTPNGDVTADFMNEEANLSYYWGDHFSAVGLPLAESGKMWFLLPDEDSSVTELLAGNALDLVIDPAAWENRDSLTVDLSIPKFDVSSQIRLEDGLKNLGITDAFDWRKADFSPVCENSEGLFLSSALHGVRVTIDEEGCTGAAYTVFTLEATSAKLEQDTVEFTADRPFLFAITGWDGQILFLGTVNHP